MSEISEHWRAQRQRKQEKRSLSPLCLYCGTRTIDIHHEWYDCPRCGEKEFKTGLKAQAGKVIK